MWLSLVSVLRQSLRCEDVPGVLAYQGGGVLQYVFVCGDARSALVLRVGPEYTWYVREDLLFSFLKTLKHTYIR